MSENTSGNRARVPVGSLRKGLYVAELDRPWTETPLLFQGFEITTDEELDILRAYCSHVWIDIERTRVELSEELAAMPVGGEPVSSPAAVTMKKLVGGKRYPDRDELAKVIKEGYSRYQQSRESIGSIARQARESGTIDAAQARDLVDDLTEIVVTNPVASLWLANLRKTGDEMTNHALNTSILALHFAEHLGLSAEECRHIGLGALLHDVGKVFTPPKILQKPGPLTREEWEIVRYHPRDGHDMIAADGGVPDTVLEIVLRHHQRLDGGGYPDWVTGSRVPLHVRVVSIANSYDSMLSPRPYRDPWAPDDALQELYNEGDNQFGARAVQEFIRFLGIFPVGSLVELNNGALAVVVGSTPEARTLPTVLLVRTPDGEPYEKRIVLNLAEQGSSGDIVNARSIRRVANPVTEDIDVVDIIAMEFGLGPLR